MQVLSTNSDGGSGPALPDDDPSYQRIYYREQLAGTLITNLFPTGPGADLSTFIGVSPYAGAYPNNGSAGGGGQSTTFDGFHYVATTSTIDQNILGYLANDSNPPLTSQPIDVHGTQIAPVTNNNNSPAAGGFTVPGCADFSTGACRLAADHHQPHQRRSRPGDVPEHHERHPDRTAHQPAGDDCRKRACPCSTRPGPIPTCWSPHHSPCPPRRQRPSAAPFRSCQVTSWTRTW